MFTLAAEAGDKREGKDEVGEGAVKGRAGGAQGVFYRGVVAGGVDD